MRTVTRYSKTGEAESLPQLNVGRYNHACGSYLTEEGDNVRLVLNISKYWIFVIQVLLVTGGLQYTGVGIYDILRSTEVLEDMAGT